MSAATKCCPTHRSADRLRRPLNFNVSQNSMPNTAKFAKILYALHLGGHLKDPDCKEPVILFIRQATEPQTQRHWHAFAHYRSKAAAEHLYSKRIRTQAQYQAICRKELSHEHVVPNIVIYRMIMETPDITEDYLLLLLTSYGIRATITREENAKLLRHSMPTGFFNKEDALFKNPFARYIAAGIYESLEKRQGDSWFANGTNQSFQRTASGGR